MTTTDDPTPDDWADTSARFRVDRKKFGFTWSCPTDQDDHPFVQPNEDPEIEGYTANCKVVLDHFKQWGTCQYIICEELHENGKRHYHAYFSFDEKIETTNARFADIRGVHPNILKKPPGKGWMKYCQKKGKFITNLEVNAYSEALAMSTASEAIEHLWAREPKMMCTQAHNIEMNIAKRFKSIPPTIVYLGPFQDLLAGTNWTPSTHSLLIAGPPGIGKTQYAKYYLSHLSGGPPQYARAHPEDMKQLDLTKPFIFDECECFLHLVPQASREVTDIENGGTLQVRYGMVKFHPGVPRIFLANTRTPFRDPANSVYGRRLVTLSLF